MGLSPLYGSVFSLWTVKQVPWLDLCHTTSCLIYFSLLIRAHWSNFGIFHNEASWQSIVSRFTMGGREMVQWLEAWPHPWRVPEFCPRHPHQAAHNDQSLQFRGTHCPLLASTGNCIYMRIHTYLNLVFKKIYIACFQESWVFTHKHWNISLTLKRKWNKNTVHISMSYHTLVHKIKAQISVPPEKP